jgi:hypothetical protein
VLYISKATRKTNSVEGALSAVYTSWIDLSDPSSDIPPVIVQRISECCGVLVDILQSIKDERPAASPISWHSLFLRADEDDEDSSMEEMWRQVHIWLDIANAAKRANFAAFLSMCRLRETWKRIAKKMKEVAHDTRTEYETVIREDAVKMACVFVCGFLCPFPSLTVRN